MDEDENWQPLGSSARRTRIDVSKAIGAIRNRKLEVRVLEGERSYSAIHVRQEDMNELSPGRPAHPTLSEFGEEVGLQKNGMMNALFEEGHISVERLLNPATRRPGIYMNKEDQAKFHARFTTLKLLSLSTGLESRELVRRIRSAGVRQFRQGGNRRAQKLLPMPGDPTNTSGLKRSPGNPSRADRRRPCQISSVAGAIQGISSCKAAAISSALCSVWMWVTETPSRNAFNCVLAAPGKWFIPDKDA